MSFTVFVVDSHADFRRLVCHHITASWPHAQFTHCDPSQSGLLPDSFAANPHDLIILGHPLSDTDALEVLQSFRRIEKCPPIVFLPGNDDKKLLTDALQSGADICLKKSKLTHALLVQAVRRALAARSTLASTQSLFVGDQGDGDLAIRGYRLLKKLSASTISSVYLTYHEPDSRHVVLKVLRQVPDPADDGHGMLERFLQEFELIAALKQPNIVQIYDFGVGDDHAFIAMEFIEGGDLREHIRGGIEPALAFDYMRQIAKALRAMHSVGIVHRDLKPGNIMRRKDGSLALIDFGLAKKTLNPADLTGTGEIYGTPYYMSPEQGRGAVTDSRADIYSLGVIFYEMLTGEKAHQASTPMAVVYKHNHAPVPLLPENLRQYQSLLERMMAKDMTQRFRSIDELLRWRQ